MNLKWFIANRLGKKEWSASKRLSGAGNLIAILSVAISVIVIIIAISVSIGFKTEVKEKAIGFGSDLTITPASLIGDVEIDSQNYSLKDLDLESLKAIPFVESVASVSYRPGMIKTDDQIHGVILKGVDSSYNWNFFKESLVAGSLPHFDKDSNYLLISEFISNKLNLYVGESTLLYFIYNNTLKIRKFIISGIYSAKFEKYDQIYVLSDKSIVNDLNSWPNHYSNSYEILYKDHSEDLEEYRKGYISNILYDKLLYDYKNITVLSLKDRLPTLFDWLALLDINVLILLVFMILVAGFNMVSALLIILFENTSTIALFKSLGMRDKEIKGVFLAKSIKIILYGLLLGDLVALSFSLIQNKWHIIKLDPESYFIKYVPVDLSPQGIIFTNLICIVSIVIILLIPLHFISKIATAKGLNTK